MPAETRDRLIEATADLFWRQGYVATGVKQIVGEAGAPFASLYHFFPGGKEELGAETIRWSGARYGDLVPLIFDACPDVATAVEAFFSGAADTLETTGYADACPIATVALEVSSSSEVLREAAHEVFESWLAELTRRFGAAGIEPDQSRRLAVVTLASLEGAFVLSRAARSTEPVLVAGQQCGAAVQAALPG